MTLRRMLSGLCGALLALWAGTAAAQTTKFLGDDAVYHLAPQQGVVSLKTANYTLAIADCGTTIQAGAGATGFFTIALPAAAGFPSTCIVTVKNSDTARGKALSGFPSDLNTMLWPLQAVQVGIVNGAWATLVNPGRWKLTSAPTFIIDPVNGNNGNDGLSAGAGNAWQSLVQFNAVVTNQLDTQSQIVTALFSTATYANLNLTAQITGGGTLNLVGNGSTANSSASGVGAITVNCQPAGGSGFANVCAVVQGFTVTCSTGGNGLFIQAGYVSLFSNMTFGSCPGGFHIGVDSNNSRLHLDASYSITGGAAWHLAAIAGLIDFNSNANTATLTGTPAFTSCFAFSEIGGILISLNNWSGAATGQRYCANTAGSIFTSFGGPNFFPGNAAGSIASGGFYDLPGTPSVNACGTSPGAPAGTDRSGSVVEGTTATGCTLTFSTANAPKACSVSISNATAQAGLVVSALNATALTVAHPSASGATLYWNCPAP